MTGSTPGQKLAAIALVIAMVMALSTSLIGFTGLAGAQSAGNVNIKITASNVDDPNGAVPVDRDVTVVVTLKNLGTADGSQNVTLMFNNTTLTTQNVSVDAGNTTEVRLTGTVPVTAPGNYNLTVMTDGNTSTNTIKVIQIGDANNDGGVGSGDATLVLRDVVGLSVPSSFDPQAADTNNDGGIGSGDATLILRQVVGLNVPHPVV